MKYLSNFKSLEFGGTFYDHGQEIKVNKGEEQAIDILVREGRVTAVGDDDPAVPAGTEGSERDAFDHDGNGKPGGAPKGGNAKK